MKISVALAALLCAGLLGCSDAVPTGDPKTGLKPDMRGYFAKPGILVAENDKAHWIQSAVTGYQETTLTSKLPAKVIMQRLGGSCRFRPPNQGEHIGNVHVGGGAMHGPIYTWTQQDVMERAKILIANAQRPDDDRRKFRDDRRVLDAKGDSFRVVDVVVTETSKPVYLVLQNEFGKILWNLHLAEGAQLSHVVALGVNEIAIANLDPGVEVDMVTAATLKSCGVRPWRKMADHWRFVRNAKETPEVHEEAVARNRAAYRSYDRWFKRTFGIQSEEQLVGVERSTHVLVGPLPQDLDKRVPFRPLGGAQVIMTPVQNIAVSDEAGYQKKAMPPIRQLVNEATAGNSAS